MALHKRCRCILTVLYLVVVQAGVNNPIITCENRCGITRSDNPCLCDARCVIFNNCCEDMDVHCPDIIAEGRSKFQHLLKAKFACEISKEFVIASCPEDEETENYNLNKNESTAKDRRQVLAGSKANNENSDFSITILHERNDSANLTMTLASSSARSPELKMSTSTTNSLDKKLSGIMSLAEKLKAPRITDRSTGIAYWNSDIFICNGGNMSNALPWQSVITTNKLSDMPRNLDEFVMGQNVFFVPRGEEFSNHDQEKVFCDPNAVDVCLEEKVKDNPDLERLCRSFISYVQSYSDEKYFLNRHCFQGNHHSSEAYTWFSRESTIQTRNRFIFSTLLSLTEKNEIILVNERVKGSLDISFCRFDGGAETNDIKCVVTKCSSELYQADRTCKDVRWMCLSFSVTRLISEVDNLVQFEQFIRCGIVKYVKINSLNDTMYTKFQYDRSLNDIAYVICAPFYMSLIDLNNFWHNDNFQTLIEALYQYLSKRSSFKSVKPSDNKYQRNLKLFKANNLNETGNVSAEVYRDILEGQSNNKTGFISCVFELRWNAITIEPQSKCITGQINNTDLLMLSEFTQKGCFSVFQNNCAPYLCITHILFHVVIHLLYFLR